MADTKKKKGTAAAAVRVAKVASPGGPNGTAPSPPAGWKPSKGRINKSVVTDQQVLLARTVAGEITITKTYVDDFTNKAPAAATFAEQLLDAQAWSDEEVKANEWAAYVHEQREKKWDIALGTSDKFEPKFEMALGDDATIAKRYPNTQSFLGVWKAAAARGQVTKEANKKAAQKAPK